MNEEQVPDTKRFRLQGDNEYIIGIAGALQANVECHEPTFPFTYTEWYCENSECKTREVTAKYEGGVPGVARCLVCSSPLRFLRFLREELLLPVDE